MAVSNSVSYDGFYYVSSGGNLIAYENVATGPLEIISDNADGSDDGTVAVGGSVGINGQNYEVLGYSSVGLHVKASNGGQFFYSSDATLTGSVGGTAGYTTTGSAPICFLAGTKILTPGGELAVENLKVGDTVIVAGGETRSVLWIGVQKKSRLFSNPRRDFPVEIARGALGENLPKNPLRLSACHAVMVDGVLANASALINGCSIRFLEKSELPEVFTYYHIETEDHSLVIAEGVHAETFVDNVSRRTFDNWKEYQELYGQIERPIKQMEIPLAISQRQLPNRIKERLSISNTQNEGLERIAA